MCHELHEHEHEVIPEPEPEETKLAVHWVILIAVLGTLLLLGGLCLVCVCLSCGCLYKAKKHYSVDGDITRRNLLDDLEMQSCANMTKEEFCEYQIHKMIASAVYQVQEQRVEIVTPGLDEIVSASMMQIDEVEK